MGKASGDRAEGSESDDEVAAAITDTLLDYALLVDTARPAAWAELFCLDGEFDTGAVIAGRPALERHVTGLLRSFEATSHHVSNIRITRTGPASARASSSVYAWHRISGGGDLEIWGRYLDELRPEDGRWRFARRRVEMFGSRGGAVDLPMVERGPIR